MRFTRNRIFGLIGVLWGAGMLLAKITGSGPTPASEMEAAGQNFGAYLFGGAFLIVGLYYFIKG